MTQIEDRAYLEMCLSRNVFLHDSENGTFPAALWISTNMICEACDKCIIKVA